MKFVVSSSVLLGHMQAISKVIGGKSIYPILNNVLLVVSEDTLFATASDNEIRIEAKIKLESVEEEGEITVSAKLLLDILKEFSDQPLLFEVSSITNEIKIKSESGEFSVAGESAENYPAEKPATASEDIVMNVTTGIMLEGVTKTLFATANDELRPVMNCILIEMKDDNFTFVASDSHKLVRYKRFDAKSESGEYALVLPKKPAVMLKNILPKNDTALVLSFNNNMGICEFGDYKMTFTLIEGRFPNYNSVIPQNNNKKAIIDKRTLNNVLRRVAVVANQASNLAQFDFSEDKVIISSQDVDYSMSGHEEIVCQYEGEPISIGFKTPFVLELLSNVSTESVMIELSAPNRPGLILPYESDATQEDSLMLLMPMMV